MSTSGHINVLVIDDSRLSRTAMRLRILERFPTWKVDEAADSDQALAMTETRVYDLITVDINMPGMNGLDLGPILKEKCPNARLVFLTANIQEATRKRIDAMGAGFVPKPIKPHTVDLIVKKLKSSP